MSRQSLGWRINLIDCASSDRLSIAAGMGQTRNHDLADYYRKAASIAAIWIDADGFVGAHARGDHRRRAASGLRLI